MLLSSKLVEKCGTLQRAFQTFDVDGDQEINKQEFVSGCQRMGVQFSNHELMSMFDSMDMDRDGTISLREFLSLLSSGQSSLSNPGRQKLQNLASKLSGKFGSIQKAFQYFDIDHDRQINRNEFL